MHEHNPHTTKPAVPSSDRSFGLVFAVVFLIVALFPMANGGSPRLWAIAICTLFLLAALLRPVVLAPLNRIWTRFGLLLQRIVSPVALGIIFFFFVTPTGLVMRLFGKDSLRLRIDKSATSYWITREPPGPPPDSFKKQF